MKKLVVLAAAASLAGLAISTSATLGMTGADGNAQLEMKSGQGHPFDVGGKRIVAYYTQDAKTCGITVVLSSSEMGGMANGGTDGPQGTRISGAINPGKALSVDGDFNRSAEFLCGADGASMTARVFTREGYKAAEKAKK